jgi:hypothetical protein
MDLSDIWTRYTKGKPLFTLALTDKERAVLRETLRQRLTHHGVRALCEPAEVARYFVLFASQFLARSATRLEWAPILTDLGAPDVEATRYPELYDDVERTLRQLGRAPIVHNGDRRFLASFLREGGLPAFIGDIAGLVVTRATEVGWDGLQDESTRTWVVRRIQQAATGAAASLLSTSEGRLALADFLGDAARARAALVNAGTDLTALSTPQSVRKALEDCGIDLPSVENQDLLLGVLGSFASEKASTVRSATPLRIVAVPGATNVQLFLCIELDALGLPDLLPSNIEYATLTAEACSQGRCLLARNCGTFVDKNSQQNIVSFSRGARRGPNSVEVTFAGAGGVKNVVSAGLLPWPEANALWFDGNGELLVEERDVLQPGEGFTVVVWDDRTMAGRDGVDVRELTPPIGATRAYRIEVRGPGTLSIEGGGACGSIVAQERALDVTVANARTTDLNAVGGFVTALPDLILPVGVEADVHVREVATGTERLVRSGAHGRILLAADRWVRDLIGSVRVTVSSPDGRKWSALWRVLPRGLEVTSRAGTVRIRRAGTAVVRAEPGRVERSGEDLLVTPPAGVEQITLLVICPGGEALRLRVVVTQAPVRLCEAGENGVTLPLDGSTKLTERQVFAGAYLELAKEGATLTVTTRQGEVLLQMVQKSARVAHLPLLDLARHVQRVGESPTIFSVSVGDGSNYSFGLSVPRLAHPHARSVDGTVEFDYLLDPLDLPQQPGLALFPLRPATARHAVVKCDFERVDRNKWVARLRSEYAPTVQGRYIAFLVDTKTVPPRPMSGARAISVPLSLDDFPCSEDVSGLDRALWTRTDLATEAALNEFVGRPDLPGFLAALSHSVHERASYGLDWFHLFGTIATRCQWVLLASLRYVPEAERDAWLALWPQQIGRFTWHRFRRTDAELLARALPNRSEGETMALIERAKAAHPMLQSVEFLLQETLFSGPSGQRLASIRRVLTNAGAIRGESWGAFQLPNTPPGTRWLRGAQLDGDQQDPINSALDEQFMKGERARQIRALFVANVLPRYTPGLAPPATPLASRILDSLQKDWAPLASTQLAYHIRDLDREAVIVAMHLVEHREGRTSLSDQTFHNCILPVERCAPALLDYWLLAYDRLRQEAI